MIYTVRRSKFRCSLLIYSDPEKKNALTQITPLPEAGKVNWLNMSILRKEKRDVIL